MESIIKIMDKDHKKIKELLEIFEKDKSENSFNRFKWNVEKHFFIEEKLIFSAKSLDQENQELLDILEEHSEINNIIEKYEEELFENKNPDISELKQLLSSHAKFEDEIFYPKLDESLNPEEKQEIISRCKEVLIK